MTTVALRRAADPYRDVDVIDARAPRVNQFVVGVVSLLAFATGWWPLLTLLALQLIVGLRFGRRYCVACVFYFEVLQPRLGEGPLEDSRPPRFANQVGAVVLSAATLAHLVNLSAVGWTLGLLVAALALLASTTGLCVGCEMYRLGARIRGVRAGGFARIDPADLDAPVVDGTVVEFTHPLCTDCRKLEAELRQSGRNLIIVDVSRRSDLAHKYGVAVVPTAVTLTADGTIVSRIA